MSELEVTLAGAVTLSRGTRVVDEAAFPGRQVRLTTAMVVLERADAVPVDWLAGELWPGTLPDQWRAAVRVLVSKVRRILVDLGLPPDAITSIGGAYRVDLGSVRVDLEDATARAVRARAELHGDRVEDARRLANQARAVLSRPVLPGVDSDWIDGVRTRASDQLVDVLVVLGRCRSRLDLHAEARTALMEAVERAPLREDAWRALMGSEARAGNAGGALAAYERCRRSLAEQLGVDPSSATQQLHLEVLAAIPEPRLPATLLGRSAGAGPTRTQPVEPTLDRSPYVGLRSFHRDEADLFFGRTGEVQELVTRLDRHGIVAVVGPSGVGKSSLVRAGLLPALERGAIPDSDTWVPVVFVPGATPLKTVATELAAASNDLSDTDVASLLAGDPDGLHGAVESLLRDREPSARLLLVIDQLEELFTLGDDEQADRLVDQLTSATRRLDNRVVVVVTLRADFFDEAVRIRGVAELLSRVQFVVPPLGGEQVEEVVVGPARRAGIELEPGLLGRILTDVAGRPGALPLLQHLLYELWENRVGHAMTRGAYDDLGGVAGALASRAESVYAELDVDQRLRARRVLLRAVQPAEEGGEARRPVRELEWAGPADDRDAVETAVARLVDARLLTASHDPTTDERVVELAHEALIDGWPRLRGWVAEARGWLLDHRRVTLAAEDWQRHDRHNDWLLTGLRLDEAHELLLADGRGEVDLHLSPLEHDLVTRSLTALDHDRALEEERREHERRLERRSVRRMRALVVVGLVVALVTGVLWWTGRQDARVADGRRLAAASGEALSTDPQLALLLGLEAWERVGPGDTAVHHEIASALHAAIATDRVVARSTDVPAPMSFAPDRQVFAARRGEAEPDGTWAVDIRDAETSEILKVLSGHPGTSDVDDVGFSGDSRRVAVEASDGSVTVWDWQTGGQWKIAADPDRVRGGWVDLSGDGRHVVRTNLTESPGDTPVEVWDVDEGRLTWALDPDAIGDTAGAWPPYGHFHPSQPWVAIPLASGTVQVHDVEAGRLAWETAVPGATWAAWSPDGRWLAVAGDRFVLLDATTGTQVSDIDRTGEPSPIQWSLDSRQVSIGVSPRNPEPSRVWTIVDDDGPIAVPDPPLQLRAEPMACAMAVFGPNTTLWEASPCGSGLRRWDLGVAATAEVARLAGDGWPLSPLAFSPDGATLAANGDDGSLVAYGTESWAPTTQVDAHDPPGVVDLDFDGDGSVLATKGLDGVALWDTGTWEAIVRVDAPDWGRVAVSPDGTVVAYSSIGRTAGVDLDGEPVQDGPTADLVWVIDRRGRELAAWAWGEGQEVQALDFSPDGRVLAVTVTAADAGDANDNGTILWDWRADDVVGLVDTGQEAMVADWDPTGQRLVVTVGPPVNTAEIWDVSQAMDGGGTATAPDEAVDQDVVLHGHVQHVFDARISDDGSLVATCSRDGSARLWDAESGRQLQWLVADDLADGCTVAFSPDGRTVAVSDPATGTWAFAVRLQDVAAIAEERVVRPFTVEECREHLTLDTCPA